MLDPDQLDALGVKIAQHGEQLLHSGYGIVGHAAQQHLGRWNAQHAAGIDGDVGRFEFGTRQNTRALSTMLDSMLHADQAAGALSGRLATLAIRLLA
jgi:hypothetical protein